MAIYFGIRRRIPVSSFGPALIAGNFDGIWVFLLAPLVGGVLAALLYSFLSKEDK